MRHSAFRAVAFAVGGLLIIVQPSVGQAQTDSTKGTGKITGAAEVGWRAFTNEPSAQEKGKFLQYKDISPGAVIEQMLLKYTPGSKFGLYEIGGERLTQKDRSAWLQAVRPGLYDVQVHYDGIPHTYSTTARSLLTNTAPNVFTLPTPRPDSVAWRAAPYIKPLAVKWNATNVSIGVTPTTNLESKAEFVRIDKAGTKPTSLSFAGSSGPTTEFPEPIDHTITNLKFTQGYSSKRFQVIGSYAYSMFQNQNSFAEIPSPLNATDTPTNGAAMSRVALAPDNSAKTAVVTAAVNLPPHSRISANASSSYFDQNTTFVPQTSNSLLATNPLLAIPRNSLEGHAKTTNITISGSTHPITPLRLSARFRSFDYSNSTAPFHISAMALADRSVAAADSQDFERHPFTKTNSDFSANYQLPFSFSLTTGYAYESWKRDPEDRDVGKTTEGTPRISLDFLGVDWATLRLGYSKGWRRDDHYTDSTSNYDFPGYRRFDLGPRDRDRQTYELTITPIDQINIAISRQDWYDKYPVAYGAQSDRTKMTGIDADWTPSKRFSLGTGYSVENIDYVMKSRYKTGNRGTATFDNPSWVWYSLDKGKSTFLYANFTAVIIPDKLEGGGSLSGAYSRFHDINYNPLTPSGGTNAQNYAATAYTFPEVWYRTSPLTLYLSYRYRPDWAFTARYQWESFRQNDFRTQNPGCYDKVTAAAPTAPDPNCVNSTYNIPPGSDLSTSIGTFKFLGNNYRNYDAGWFTFTVSYRPSAMPFTRRRSAL